MDSGNTSHTGRSIRIDGTVQGVGFRPTVWKIAREHQLVGSVWNDSAGVVIQVWGNERDIDGFLQQLQSHPPPLAIIQHIHSTILTTEPPEQFTIAKSRSGSATTGVSVDAASCQYCIDEVMDPNNRRYRYPFTNCTHCGPRLSIIKAIPYDRPHTSMSTFTMCASCQQEYDNPADRRFHAQPNCCSECGPKLSLEDEHGNYLTKDMDGIDQIEHTAELIRNGKIIAIKGIGGIHLACDATNEDAVTRLRTRKQRMRKAFAVMARDCDMVSRYAILSPSEENAIKSSAAPIVILDQHGATLAPSISPIQKTIGFMLPYTPLHHLLMHALDSPIVLTSGNRSNEPQCISNEDAKTRLSGIADYWLLHDRDIINRVDDSVVQSAAGKIRTMRRGRGMAPKSITLPDGFVNCSAILAMGGELKNSFALLHKSRITLSQYIGDLEDASTFRAYQDTIHLYQNLFDHNPEAIVVDSHPDYLSTQLGRSWADQHKIPLIEVQHHHAHITACMVEHGLPRDTNPVLGIAMDGLGYGEDSQLWGGEFLVADYKEYYRAGHFAPVAMPGGSQATKEPWRNSYAHLSATIGWQKLEQQHPELELTNYLNTKPLATVETMIRSGFNTPAASSCGRLIDAVAAAIGLCRESISFEAEAAIELESIATNFFSEQYGKGYSTQLSESHKGIVIGWEPLWKEIIDDLEDGIEIGIIAARFHHCLINSIAETARKICSLHQINVIVLSGGVFQNRLLRDGIDATLGKSGLVVLSPEKFPPNDQSISIGQSVIAAERMTTNNPDQESKE